MSQSAPPGVYVLQPQTLTGQSGQGQAPGGPQPVQVVPPTAEVHYGSPGVGIGDGTANAGTQLGAYVVDAANSGTLSNRVSMEFYNSGTNDIEISTNQNFIFGKNQGRTIKAGASWSITIAPANVSGGVKHYALCGSGNVCQLEVTELGQ